MTYCILRTSSSDVAFIYIIAMSSVSMETRVTGAVVTTDGVGTRCVHMTGQCKDINECTEEDKHDCHVNATCSNTIGGHNCTCNPGFHGNGTHCYDINECNITGTCSQYAVCHNNIGSYACSCPKGFNGTGYNATGGCVDLDECNDTSICHGKALCTNLPGTYQCDCQPPWAGNGTSCFFSMLDGSTATKGTGDVIQEEILNLDGLYGNTGNFKAIFLTTVSGKQPGTIVQNMATQTKDGKDEMGVMYYSSSDVHPKYFHWLGVNKDMPNTDKFQSGHKKVTYQIYEKCVNISFTQELSSQPVVILQLYAIHKLNPFFLDYSLTWAENITTHGFTACLHEAVLFSGNHTAQISYLAVAKDDASVHQDYAISESAVLSFPVGDLKCDSEDNLGHFCKKYTFSKRYNDTNKIKVFVSSELDSKAVGAGEQTTWVLRTTHRDAWVCTKNTEDDGGRRNFHANISVVIAGGAENEECTAKIAEAQQKNLDCVIENGKAVLRCVQKDTCQHICNSQVCGSDHGTYLTHCHAEAETCAMYGADN
jgi:hypothetical protein